MVRVGTDSAFDDSQAMVFFDSFPKLFDDNHRRVFIAVILPTEKRVAGGDKRIVAVVKTELFANGFGESKVNRGIEFFFAQCGKYNSVSKRQVVKQDGNNLLDSARKLFWLRCI